MTLAHHCNVLSASVLTRPNSFFVAFQVGMWWKKCSAIKKRYDFIHLKAMAGCIGAHAISNKYFFQNTLELNRINVVRNGWCWAIYVYCNRLMLNCDEQSSVLTAHINYILVNNLYRHYHQMWLSSYYIRVHVCAYIANVR